MKTLLAQYFAQFKPVRRFLGGQWYLNKSESGSVWSRHYIDYDASTKCGTIKEEDYKWFESIY